MNIAKNIRDELRSLADAERAIALRRFFKTGKGEYGEGDEFLGIRVPDVRATVKKFFRGATFSDVRELLRSRYHEERLAALVTLVLKFRCAEKAERKTIVDLYLRSSGRINNWDLVDLSAPYILGRWVSESGEREVLYSLTSSKNMWERRMAVVANLWLIRKGNISDAVAISEILLHDEEDLMHKAVGWVMREVGKKDKRALVEFLDEHSPSMPRTTLRYSIERFSDRERLKYLSNGKRKNGRA